MEPTNLWKMMRPKDFLQGCCLISAVFYLHLSQYHCRHRCMLNVFLQYTVQKAIKVLVSWETKKCWWHQQNLIVCDFLAYKRDRDFYLTNFFFPFLHSARMTAQPCYPFENIYLWDSTTVLYYKYRGLLSFKRKSLPASVTYSPYYDVSKSQKHL